MTSPAAEPLSDEELEAWVKAADFCVAEAGREDVTFSSLDGSPKATWSTPDVLRLLATITAAREERDDLLNVLETARKAHAFLELASDTWKARAEASEREAAEMRAMVAKVFDEVQAAIDTGSWTVLETVLADLKDSARPQVQGRVLADE